jgi:hypothetical protein
VEIVKSTETESKPETDHAIENGRGWLSSIVEMVTAYEKAQETEEPQPLTDFDKPVDADTIMEHIEESPLSVEVREPWHAPGVAETPSEYNILLSTGGPALRLIGELSEHGYPENARLEHQDWFKPWTELRPLTDAEEAALLSFARCFYFGE